MIQLMNRSIDLLDDLAERSGNVFHMTRRGYLYVTGDSGHLPRFITAADSISRLGGGELRRHSEANSSTYLPSAPSGYQGMPGGADLLLGAATIQQYFPGITDKAIAALHVRKAGWFSAQKLGMYLLGLHAIGPPVRTRSAPTQPSRPYIISRCYSPSRTLMFRNYIQPETGFTRLSSQGRFFAEHRREMEQEMPSEEVAKLLGPLANSYRIEIMKMISRQEMSFTQISKTLGLRTGHLQFHLGALKKAGYVRSSRRRRSYSLTAKGIAALEGLNQFFEALSEKKKKPSAFKI